MNYNKLFPKNSFIDNYMTFMNNMETATDYDFFAAIWLLSCACQRNIIVDRPQLPIQMNFYCIFVAESGITRKSTAVSTATKIINKLIEDDPTVALIEGKTTPEALDEIIAEKSRNTGSGKAIISISELAVFLGLERYNATMPTLLTDLYDCPQTRKAGGTLSRGAITQTNVFISFLSASTPSWLHQSVNPNIVAGGFTSRCLFIVSEQAKRRIAWPSTSVGITIDDLTRQLKTIKQLCKEISKISVSEDGVKAYTSWYLRRNISYDAFTSSFESREADHVLRMAGFLCINDNSFVIKVAHVKSAIKIIHDIKYTSAKLFEGTTARTNWMNAIVKLREVLLGAGTETIAKSVLTRTVRNFITVSELDALLDVLHECNMIQKFELTQNGRGRPTIVYRATKLLIAKNANKTIISKLIG